MKISKPPTKFRNLRAVTGTGLKDAPASITSATAQAPVIDPSACSIMQVLGVDAVPFSFAAAAAPPTLTFPNLPKRDNQANPLRASPNARPTLTIQPKDHLIFVTFVQGLTAPQGVIVATTPQALTKDNVAVPGPFFGANTFLTFQTVLNVIAPPGPGGAISGMVVGLLFLSVG